MHDRQGLGTPLFFWFTLRAGLFGFLLCFAWDHFIGIIGTGWMEGWGSPAAAATMISPLAFVRCFRVGLSRAVGLGRHWVAAFAFCFRDGTGGSRGWMGRCSRGHRGAAVHAVDLHGWAGGSLLAQACFFVELWKWDSDRGITCCVFGGLGEGQKQQK